ncbi:hypothetical protein [Paenibacillus sp. V4I9]|nr:hypothetical protein [Paenibacillus sp. V4I9]
MGNEAIQYLLDKHNSDGENGSTVLGYANNENLTMAEALQFKKTYYRMD